MQLGRLFPRGLVSLNFTARGFFSSRLAPSRIRVCVASNEASDNLPGQERDELRVPGSRRTLFQDAAPPASAEAVTSTRELLDIHKQSLQDAGVNLSPREIQRNRLHSVRTSLRKEARGPVRAAVTREFRERRLYGSSTRRTRQKDQAEVEVEEELRSRRKQHSWEGEGKPDREEGSTSTTERPTGEEQVPAKRGEARKMTKGRKAAKEQDFYKAKEFAARAAAKYVAAHTSRMRHLEAASARLGDNQEDDEDEDEDEDAAEGTIEGEESLSLEDRIREIQGAPSAAGKVRPVTTDAMVEKPLHGPKLTHNLPPELNLRLLEAVLLGSKHICIPEITMGTSGINNGVINSMLLAWRTNEMVKMRISDKRKVAKKYLPYIRQVCDVLESRSGGVVVWRSGRSIWVYRGKSYQPVDPKQVADDLLGKSEVPVYTPELSARKPLQGRMVEIPQGKIGAYLTRGSVELFEDDSSGVPSPPEGLGVIFLHDAFGLGSPRTQEHCKQVCDMLASLVGPGTPVLMPDLTNGGQDGWQGPLWPPDKPIYERQNGWLGKEGRGNPAAVAPYIDAAVSYMRGPEVGASRLVLVGTGWGGWLALNMMAADATKLVIEAEAAEEEADAAMETTRTTAVAATRETPSTPGGKSPVIDRRLLGKAALRMLEVMKGELPEDAGPLQRGIWMMYGPEAKAYRQAKTLVRYGGGRPKQVEPDVYTGDGLLFSAGAVGSPSHFFNDEERIALAISVPLCFVCSKFDPMEKFQLYMMPPLVDKCAFKRFGKIKPGFWGKLAEWSVPVQGTQATQATELAGWFLRWHLAGDVMAEERVRKHCMIGKSGVGEKQTTNLGFPWLEQVLLFKGREKQLEREEKLQRKEQGLPEVLTRKEQAKKARQAAKKEREAARRERHSGRELGREGARERKPEQLPQALRAPRDRWGGGVEDQYNNGGPPSWERQQERDEHYRTRPESPPRGGHRAGGSPQPPREPSWGRRQYWDNDDMRGQVSPRWEGRGLDGVRMTTSS